MFIRDAWIAASEFHPLPGAEVLKRILREVETRARAGAPLVLLDLDQTVYHNGPRTRRILQEAARALGAELPREVTALLSGLTEDRMGFSLRDTFRLNGLPTEGPPMADALAKLRAYWWDRFFTSEYLVHDVPYPGAAAYARSLHGSGAHVVYLTARNRDTMEEGTLHNLARDGFPCPGNRVTLMMKETAAVKDGDHKAAAAGWAGRLGAVVAAFENEPRHVADLQRLLPSAMHVFVETVCSDQPAPACRGLYRIKNFEL